MTTFFDTMTKSFVDVPTDPGIATVDYLEASRSLVKLFDLLGSTAFGAVISDMNGNIKKIQDRYDAAPEKSATLEQLCDSDVAENKHVATQGLLWLNRGLEFTCQALEKNQASSAEELADSFTHSYGNTLKPHHNFVVKGIFSVAMKATPYRADFYKKLGDDQAKVESQLKAWLAALSAIVAKTNALFASKKDEWKWEKW